MTEIDAHKEVTNAQEQKLRSEVKIQLEKIDETCAEIKN